ncbi:hypothetical protein [Sphingomonas sp. M1-B02]|uniref:hypothetical protein n=1 Tax=Sphingomonas sp. M1-B02 TaxID=3114300 RepID=UPI0022401EF8|nr:hypothetical protein [Sphingomonas sp. S6-11]UZK67426.1 hypothetical protein OKW87_06230 [Sphingomonas sp. S6-11]
MSTPVCGGDPFNIPFQKLAAARKINPLNSTAERKFSFSRKASTRWGVADTGADATAILAAAGVPPTVGPINVKAEVKGALDRFKTTTVNMTGTYYFVVVDLRIVQSLRNPETAPELATCNAWLRKAPSNSVITSLTGVKIETATDSGSLASTLTAGLDAKLATALTNTQFANLKAEMERKVNTDYSGAFAPTFQILSIGHNSLK